MRPTSQRPSRIEAFQAADHWAQRSPASLLALRTIVDQDVMSPLGSQRRRPSELPAGYPAGLIGWLICHRQRLTLSSSTKKLYTASKDLHRVGRAARLGILFSGRRHPTLRLGSCGVPLLCHERTRGIEHMGHERHTRVIVIKMTTSGGLFAGN